jgi:hypothetical protein
MSTSLGTKPRSLLVQVGLLTRKTLGVIDVEQARTLSITPCR